MQILTENALKAAHSYNETEVRFHIVDPIIRQLGYPGKDDVYLKLEEKLEYPYLHIGRRSKKDLPLGFPDYRAGLKGARGSFVIEAKAGNVAITSKEIEQAHSYAAHAQVGANYFALCNGSYFMVFQTLSGANAAPLVEIPISDLNERYHEIENVLSSTSLAKNCQVNHDTKLKLADGLGSSVAIRSGRYLASECNYRILINGQDNTELMRQSVPQIRKMDEQLELIKTAFELRVSQGNVERDEHGRILASVTFDGATIYNHAAMTIMGITDASFATADKFISTDPDNPTIFESTKDFSIARGTEMPQLFGGAVQMEHDVTGDMFIKAGLYIEDSKIVGQYIAFSKQRPALPGGINMVLELDISGTFDLTLNE